MRDFVMGMVRHALTAAGGSMVAAGYIDASQEAALIGAAMVLVGLAWSFGQKRGFLPVVALLALPALSACGTNWREAAVPAVICAMDAAGRVQAIADGHDSDGVKALQAAAAAGATLATNAACQAAMATVAAR